MSEQPTTAAIVATLVEEWRALPSPARLPSDRILAERFAVGRGVIARLMADLERQGLVRRQRGAGSFWLGAAQHVAPTTPPSFAHAMRAAGLTPGSVLLGQEVRRVATTEREHLGLAPNSMVWRIQRLLTVEDIPVGVATSVLPARDLTGLAGELESYGSLFETLRRRYHRDPVRVWKRRRAVPEIPRFVGEAFGLRDPIAARLEESLNRASDGTPIEYARTFMRADALSTDALIRRTRCPAGVRIPRQEAYRR